MAGTGQAPAPQLRLTWSFTPSTMSSWACAWRCWACGPWPTRASRLGISRNRNSRRQGALLLRSMLVVHKLLPTRLLAMWELVHGNPHLLPQAQVL